LNHIKQLAGQTVIYGLSSIIPKFLNYILVPLHTRIFADPAAYGVVTELYAYVTFLNILLTYGMETGYFRFANSEKDPLKVYNNCLISLFITSFIFVLFVLIFSQQIANFLNYPNHKEYIIWFGLILGIDSVMAIPFVKLRQENRPIKFAFYKIFSVLINLVLNFFFLVLCPFILKHHPHSFIHLIYNSHIGVGYIFISNLIASALTLVLLFTQLRDIKLKLDPVLLKRIILYSLPLLVAGIVGNINEAADRVLLKYLLPSSVNGMEQLGLFGANIKIPVIMALFTQMFRFAAEPFFFSKVKEGNAKEIFADVTKYFVIFGMLIFLGVMLYIDVVKLFIGHSYYRGLGIVPVMLLANLFLGIFFNLSMWYKLNNWTKYGIYIAIVGALVTVAVNVLFVPRYGIIACAYAHLVCYVVMVLMSYLMSRKFYFIKYDLKSILLYLFLGLLIFYISQNVHLKGLILKLIFNSFLFVGFLYFIMKKEKIKPSALNFRK
jgi:O-antigen/teichoic acid export membrane protein